MRSAAGGPWERVLCQVAIAGAVLACGVALLNLAVGGITVHAGPLRISSNGLFRPLAAAAIFVAAASWLSAIAQSAASHSPVARRHATAVACAAITLIVGLVFNTGVAG